VRVGTALLVTGVLAVFASTAQAAAPQPCMHSRTFAGVRYNEFCGPASVTLHVRGETYRISAGFCQVDADGNFHVTAGSVDAEKAVGSALRKTLRLPFFSLLTASRSHGGKYAMVDIGYALPGDHPPGEAASPATATVVGGTHGSFSARYAQPPISGTFHC